MGFQKYLLSNLLSTGSIKYLAEGVGILSSLVISRFLFPEDIGLIAMIVLFYAFLMKFSDLGVSELVIRESISSKTIGQIRKLFLVKGAVLGLVMVLITYPISLFFNEERIVLPGFCYGVFLLLYALPKTDVAVLRKNERFVTLAKTELIVASVQAILTIILAIYGLAYWSLVLPHFILPLIYWKLLGDKARPYYPKEAHVQPLSFKALMTSIGIIEFVRYWEERLDNLLAGKIYGEGTLGVYNRAYMLISLPVTLIHPLLENILLPAISRNKLDAQNIWTEVERIHGLLFGLFFIPFVLFTYYPTTLSVFLWGESWSGVGKYLALLAPALYWQLFIASTRSLYLYFRKENQYLQQVLINGMFIIGLMVTGALFSMERMILYYLAGLLWIAVPITAYLGYIRLLGVPLKRMLVSYGGHFVLLSYWQLALFMPDMPFQEENIILLGLLSGYKIFEYIRLLIRQNE